MSHELRTPLNAVIGYSEMMINGLAITPEKQEKYANNIALSGYHLLEMINDILDLAKIEAGKVELSIQNIDLNVLMNEVEDVVNGLIQIKNIDLTFQIQPNIGHMDADPSRLKQIFYNLIGNAVKFNHQDGNVLIRLYKSDDKKWLICEVEDTGIGIPENKINELFTEFYQVDSLPARNYEGTGLGLVLTKRLIELHHGEISVTSQEGIGSIFVFKLPIE